MFRGRERVLLSIQRPVQRLSFFFRQSFPGDGDVLKMLNAHCFHRDNTFMLYFLELFPLAVKPNSELCCIQLASHRQQRRSLNGPNKKSWTGHFTDEHRVPLTPPPPPPPTPPPPPNPHPTPTNPFVPARKVDQVIPRVTTQYRGPPPPPHPQ